MNWTITLCYEEFASAINIKVGKTKLYGDDFLQEYLIIALNAEIYHG